MKNLFNPYFLGNEFSDKNSLKSRIWMLYKTSERKTLWRIIFVLPVLLLCAGVLIYNSDNEIDTSNSLDEILAISTSNIEGYQNNELEKMWENSSIDSRIVWAQNTLSLLKNGTVKVSDNLETLKRFETAYDTLKQAFPERAEFWKTQDVSFENRHSFSFKNHMKPNSIISDENDEPVGYLSQIPKNLKIGYTQENYNTLDYEVTIFEASDNSMNQIDNESFKNGINSVKDSKPVYRKIGKGDKIDFSDLKKRIQKPAYMFVNVNKVQYNPSADTLWSADFDSEYLILIQ